MTADVRRRITGEGAIAGVNIVPVIDLCLVLLVILLIVSPMLDKSPVEVELPQARTAEETGNSLAITIGSDGRLAIKDGILETPEQLGLYLKKVVAKDQGFSALIIIRSDKDLPYGELTDLIKVIKEAGFNNLALGTKQIKDTP